MTSTAYQKIAQFILAAALAPWAGACGEPDAGGRCQIERRNVPATVIRVSGDCSAQDFTGVDLTQADTRGARWGQGATCPDGTRSGDHGGTCQGHLSPAPPDLDLGPTDDDLDAPPDEPPPDDLAEAPDTDLPDPGDATEPDITAPDVPDTSEPDTSEPDTSEPDADAPDGADLPDEPDACAPNACGGCEALEAAPGDPCGACNSGAWGCVGDNLRCLDEAPCSPPTCAIRQDCQGDDYCVEGFCTSLSQVFLPPGTWTLGAPDSDPYRRQDELSHQVRLTHGVLFDSDEFPQWNLYTVDEELIPEPAPCHEDPTLALCPLVTLNWYEAIALTNLISAQERAEQCYTNAQTQRYYTVEDARARREVAWPRGLQCTGWRLPTEAEWEAAARDGSDQPWPCGQNPECLEAFAIFDQTSGGLLQNGSPGGDHPYSLSDVLGNAWEWVWDWYGPYPEGLTEDPLGPAAGTHKIARGGCYRCEAQLLRPAYRHRLDPALRSQDVGVRMVRSWR